MHVLIIGAGIGGISAALALRRAGIDFTILEQAPAIEAVGAGIQLSPNATRILHWLGVAPRLAPNAVRPDRHRFRDWQTGEDILTTPLGDAAEEIFGWPYWHAHRADLQSALLETLGADVVKLETEVTEIHDDGDGVRAETADGTTYRGEVLFGADGIHSMVRARIFKPDPPRYSGNMAWRALVPGDLARELGIERASHVWMGQGASMVIYYVSGGRLLNWVGVCRAERAPEESWTARGETRDALRDYEGWHPEIHTLIEAAGSPLKWAIHDRDPLQAWTAGRIALLGDAAHSMLPFHAQGAAQGIEDAWVLARCLEIEGDHEAAFARYESLRIGRANHVQEMSRAVERVVQADGADAIKRRDRRFREQHAKHQDGFTPGQKWLYAYDAERAVLGEAMDWADANW